MPADGSVSVVMPVRDEAAKIAACIDGILSQTIQVREIVVVDSGSVDGTLEILARYPEVRVIRVDPAEFNHGETRNVGVRAASTEWVVLTVGDARPADNKWIEQLLAGVTDERVAAVSGSQVVPHERDKNPVAWFRPVSPPSLKRYQFASASEFDALPPAEKLNVCGWDDVTAIYRREILLKIPFQAVNYAEDALWARDALRAGYALVFNPAARVYHYHAETADFTFRRTIAAMYVRYQAFGYLYEKPTVTLPLLRAASLLVRERAINWRERFSWIRYTLQNQLAVRAADRAFRTALAAGDSEVKRLYETHCGRAPVPEKGLHNLR